MFRLNIGLAEGEERGLMGDGGEHNTQRNSKVLESEVDEGMLQNRDQLQDSLLDNDVTAAEDLVHMV